MELAAVELLVVLEFLAEPEPRVLFGLDGKEDIMKFARVLNGKIMELIEVEGLSDLRNKYHPDLVFERCPDEAKEGWMKTSKGFEPPVISPTEYKNAVLLKIDILLAQIREKALECMMDGKVFPKDWQDYRAKLLEMKSSPPEGNIEWPRSPDAPDDSPRLFS
jgi:hypothetical protein